MVLYGFMMFYDVLWGDFGGMSTSSQTKVAHLVHSVQSWHPGLWEPVVLVHATSNAWDEMGRNQDSKGM